MTSCTTSPRRSAAAFLQQSVLTFDHLQPSDPDADAIELEVPHVTAQALRNGLLADPVAQERLFGGSVTLDGHLLLVADRADADLARSFAKRIGGDVKRAVTRYGKREFVSAATAGRAQIDKHTLVITGTGDDDTIALRDQAAGSRSTSATTASSTTRSPATASTGSASTAATAAATS